MGFGGKERTIKILKNLDRNNSCSDCYARTANKNTKLSYKPNQIYIKKTEISPLKKNRINLTF